MRVAVGTRCRRSHHTDSSATTITLVEPALAAKFNSSLRPKIPYWSPTPPSHESGGSGRSVAHCDAVTILLHHVSCQDAICSVDSGVQVPYGVAPSSDFGTFKARLRARSYTDSRSEAGLVYG